MMIKRYKRTTFCLMFLWLTAACVATESSATTSPLPESTGIGTGIAITQQPTFKLSPITATESPIGTTPDVTPTFVSIFDNPESVTDGTLKLSIKTSDQTCYKPGDVTHLTVTYENLTNTSLTIVNYNVIASAALFGGPAQLFPVFTTVHNEEVFTPEDFVKIDMFGPNPPLFREVSARSTFNVSVGYYFPPETIDANGRGPAQPLPPGTYLLKFVYFSIGKNGSWEGAVSSNQIKICIVD